MTVPRPIGINPSNTGPSQQNGGAICDGGNEQRDDLLCLAVNSRYIRALMIAASEASKTEVSDPVRASMLFGDVVVDRKGKFVMFLGEMAVFAAIAGPLPYQFLQCAYHACSVRLGGTVVLPALMGTPGL